MANLCSCSPNTGGDKQKRCYFKLLMDLMNQRYYSKLKSHVQSDQIDLQHQNILFSFDKVLCSLTLDEIMDRFDRSPRIKCCNAHDKYGFQCTKPVLDYALVKKGKGSYIPLYRCYDHISNPPNKWEEYIFRRYKFWSGPKICQCDINKIVFKDRFCIHDFHICNERKKCAKITLDQINRNNGSCKHQKPNKNPCPNSIFLIDYKNKIHFLCIKHHYKYIKSQYSLFKAEQVEFLRTILQPKMDLLTYQAIMSKISFLKLQNKSVLK
jgi:hypothetical protein